MKKIIKKLALFSGINLTSSLSGFILLALYIRNLTGNDFIIMERFNYFFMFLNIIFTLEINSSLVREYNYYKSNNNLHILIGNTFGYIFVTTILLAFFCVFYFNFFSIFENPFLFIFPLTLKYLFLNTFITIQTVLRFENKDKSFFTLNVALYSFQVLMILGSIQFELVNFIFFIWIITISYFCISVPFMLIYSDFFITNLRFSKISSLISYSWPASLISLGNWANEFLGRLILSFFVTPSSFIVLVIAFKVSMVFRLIFGVVKMITQPRIFKKLTFGVDQNYYNNSLKIYIMLSAILIIFLQILSPLLIRALSDSIYMDANNYLPFILYSNFLLGCLYFMNVGNVKEKKLLNNAIGTIVGFLFNLSILYFTFKYLYLFSIPLGLIISTIISFLIIFNLSQKLFYVNFNYQKFFLINIYLLSLCSFFSFVNIYFYGYIWFVFSFTSSILVLLLIFFTYKNFYSVNLKNFIINELF